MTKDEARIIILEDNLVRAYNTIEFLHGCLTYDVMSYEYPDQTANTLRGIATLVEIPDYCIHSMHMEDCESCQEHIRRTIRLSEANEVLNANV